jgi:hypothetical protein
MQKLNVVCQIPSHHGDRFNVVARWGIPTGANVFCFLSSLPLLPLAAAEVFGSWPDVFHLSFNFLCLVLLYSVSISMLLTIISLLLINTGSPVRACGLALIGEVSWEPRRRAWAYQYLIPRWGIPKGFYTGTCQRWGVRQSSGIRKFADLNNMLDFRTFHKCCNTRICDLRTQSFM